MRKGREIIGLPVINLATGKEIGHVSDLVWCPETRKITGIILNGGGVLSRPRLIRYQDVVNIGRDAVIVTGEAPEGEADPATGLRATQVAGIPVITARGENLGTMEDVVFTMTGGELAGYEISAGLVDDLISGRSTIPWDAVATWGEEAVIIKDVPGLEAPEPRRESNAVSHLQE